MCVSIGINVMARKQLRYDQENYGHKPMAPVSVNCCSGVGVNVAGANGYEWHR